LRGIQFIILLRWTPFLAPTRRSRAATKSKTLNTEEAEEAEDWRDKRNAVRERQNPTARKDQRAAKERAKKIIAAGQQFHRY